MTREELRALWDAKEAAQKAYNAAYAERSGSDPDARFAAEIDQQRLLEAAANTSIAFKEALKIYSAEQATA